MLSDARAAGYADAISITPMLSPIELAYAMAFRAEAAKRQMIAVSRLSMLFS